ncbi:MAG: hypothetical protein HY269_10845 [Deltaproteobacteria bacterium]|nr:hypothetical protein [Deltaproteobacteria bacterium]
MTIVFESSSDLVSKFGLVAAAEGLWKIACPLTVRYGYSLWDPKSDATAVKRALTAMPTLFKDVFMQYCSYPAECSSDANDNPLNLTCYMWFDIIGLDCCELNEIPDERIRWALEALKAVLELPHIACQKSALHGLGHIAGYRPAIVKPIIAEFIGRSPKIPSNLQTYAERAAEGQVI